MSLDLEAIKQRTEKATPGPWEHDSESVNNNIPDVELAHAGSIIGGEHWHIAMMEGDGPHPSADAAFIASARTDIPALLAEVERLREALDRIRKTHGHQNGLRTAREIAKAALAEGSPKV